MKAEANIIETNSLELFENAAKAAGNDSIIIFDVQEVLMVASDQILSPLYKSDYRLIKDEIIANHTPAEQEQLFSIILKEYETENVDLKLIKTLEDLKVKGVKVLALTSGYTGKYGVIESREDLRLERLKRIGIDFTHSFPNVEPIMFLDLKGKDPKHIPMFKDGVLFASRISKGKVLKAFLEKINYKPKKIIFVDNQLKNLEDVQRYCAAHHIDFKGFHYNFIRSKQKIALNQAVIDLQFKTLKKDRKWISDKEALKQLLRN